ncbi:MAG: hypothetical protein QOJ08_1715 [Ilumatobacteraceae bacterium]
MHPQGFLFAGGIVTPQFLEDPIGRHHTVDVQQEQREQGALLVGAEIDSMSVNTRFERAEDAELHHAPSS